MMRRSPPRDMLLLFVERSGLRLHFAAVNRQAGQASTFCRDEPVNDETPIRIEDCRQPASAQPARDADDGAVSSRSRRRTRIRCCSTAWAISTSCSSTTPRWPAGRSASSLTKRGKHQGQDIPMCGVPVHAADDYLQKLIGLGLPRRRLRADRGSGRGEEARRQIGGAARRGAAGDARHDHRGQAAGAVGIELS